MSAQENCETAAQRSFSKVVFDSFLTALVCNVLLNLPVAKGNVPDHAIWLLGVADYRGIIFLWVLLMLLSTATRLHLTSITAFLCLSVAISIINFAKISFLRVPLLPSDIKYLGEIDLFVQLINPLWI